MNIYGNNPAVTELLDRQAEHYSHMGDDLAIYAQYGGATAQLHILANKFPEVQAYLENLNKFNKQRKAS